MSKSPVNFINYYKRSLILSSMYVSLLLYPLFVAIFNIPHREADLEKINLQIISASAKHPNLTETIDQKSIVNLDFPSSTYSLMKGFGGIRISNDDIEKLNLGCTGNALIDKIKFIPFSSCSRAWAIDCGNVHIQYDKEFDFYKKHCFGKKFPYRYI